MSILKEEKITWPYIIKYGNKYVCNKEESNKELPIVDDLAVAAMDFLESVQNDYTDENGNLPEDWYVSMFVNIEDLIS